MFACCCCACIERWLRREQAQPYLLPRFHLHISRGATSLGEFVPHAVHIGLRAALLLYWTGAPSPLDLSTLTPPFRPHFAPIRPALVFSSNMACLCA